MAKPAPAIAPGTELSPIERHAAILREQLDFLLAHQCVKGCDECDRLKRVQTILLERFIERRTRAAR